MPEISQLGHVALVTPNIERSLWFFRDLLGMEEVARKGDSVYLRCYQELEHHSLILRDGNYTGVDHFAFRTQRPEDVAQFASALRKAGVDVKECPRGTELGQGDAIRFRAPHMGHPIELFYEIDKPKAPEKIRSHLPTNSSTRRGLGVRRLDHINIAAPANEVDASTRWLRDQLGFHIREYFQPKGAPGMVAAWVSVTPQPHDIALMPDPLNGMGRLHHIAFNLEAHSDTLTAADVMTDHRIKIDAAPGKHGISQGTFFYVRDPGSGHRVELYAGGYLVFAPDWEPVHWTELNFLEGLCWYGPPLAVTPEHGMYGTTPSYESDDDAKSHGKAAAAA